MQAQHKPTDESRRDRKVLVRLTPREFDALMGFARQEDRSISYIVRRSLAPVIAQDESR